MSEDTVRTREDYNALDKQVERERSGVTDEGAVNYDELLEDLDGLYNERVANTQSTTMVERDQETFKMVNSAVYDSLNARARNSVGRITTQMLVNGIWKRRAIERVLMEEPGIDRNNAPDQDAFEEQIRKRARHSNLEEMGNMLYRGSSLLLGEPWTPFSPTLGGDPVERRVPANRGPREQEPTSANQERPETGAINEGLEDTSDQRQLKLQNLVIHTVKEYEAKQKAEKTNKPLLIHRLCYDFNLSKCIENFFMVSILVKECKLKLDACQGLPVVSSVPENAEEEVQVRNGASNTDQDKNNDTRRTESSPALRQQMNISLDQQLHERMRRLFHEPMIVRENIGILNVDHHNSEGENELTAPRAPEHETAAYETAAHETAAHDISEHELLEHDISEHEVSFDDSDIEIEAVSHVNATPKVNVKHEPDVEIVID